MEKERFIVYGAGRVGKRIVDLLQKQNRHIEMIWDKNSQKKNQYNGISIRNPYEDSSILDRYKDTKILLGLASPQANDTVYEY